MQQYPHQEGVSGRIWPREVSRKPKLCALCCLALIRGITSSIFDSIGYLKRGITAQATHPSLVLGPSSLGSSSLSWQQRRHRLYTMAEFVRAQIFGTCFEITSRYVSYRVCYPIWDNLHDGCWQRGRYVDLQPVGMGAFGLVWYLFVV
jgi:hypothetical protein